MSNVLASIVSTETNANLLTVIQQLRYSYVVVCGTWLFVHNDPFTLKEHIKTAKTGKTRSLYVKKR